MGLFAFDLSDEAYKQGEAATRAQQTLLETLARPTLKPQIDLMWKRVATRPRRFETRTVIARSALRDEAISCRQSLRLLRKERSQ